MPDAATQRLTQVLSAVRAGDRHAAAELLPLVYDQLRALARSRIAGLPPGNTLQPTALVHEAYLRLVAGYSGDGEDPGWQSRSHFFGAAARAMRDILVEQARRKASGKRGGGMRREGEEALAAVPETPPIAPPTGLAADMLALDQALRELEQHDSRKAEVIMLTHFAGLTREQVAESLNVSVPTVDRDLKFARAWLARAMRRAGDAS